MNPLPPRIRKEFVSIRDDLEKIHELQEKYKTESKKAPNFKPLKKSEVKADYLASIHNEKRYMGDHVLRYIDCHLQNSENSSDSTCAKRHSSEAKRNMILTGIHRITEEINISDKIFRKRAHLITKKYPSNEVFQLRKKILIFLQDYNSEHLKRTIMVSEYDESCLLETEKLLRYFQKIIRRRHLILQYISYYTICIALIGGVCASCLQLLKYTKEQFEHVSKKNIIATDSIHPSLTPANNNPQHK